MIIIIRHGETLWNLKKKKQGHKNSKLTPKGKKQAIKVAKFLNRQKYNINEFTIFASPLKRVIDYTRIINLNLTNGFSFKKNVRLSNLIKEHKFGNWEGMSDVEIEKKYPGQIEKRKFNRWKYKIPGGGESYEILFKRVKKFIRNGTGN